MKAALVLGVVPSLMLVSAMGPAHDTPTHPDPPAALSIAPVRQVVTTASAPRPVRASAVQTRSCAAVASSLPLAGQVGQLFMVGVNSAGLNASTARVLRRDRVGSIVLLGGSRSGRARVRAVVSAAGRAAGNPGGVRLLAATDQEGGSVQRLRGNGFRRIPSAARQARLSDAALRRSSMNWARELRLAGVKANLAPVADVVPPGMRRVNRPIGRLARGYGSSPAVVAARTSAVVTGHHQVGVATAVKHFPGLGAVRGNTDHTAHVVDRTTRRGDPGLAGFAATVRRGTDMVMVSSATYTRIDPRRMALFSPTVMTMLRRDLGFRGVIVSDDVGVARALAPVRPRDRAARFLGAGGDLVINASPALNHQMVSGVLVRARGDRAFRRTVQAAATRVLTLKARYGLVACR